ncbi:MAG: hypothetical protein ACI9FJ_002968, partial [Alteromonadaceae bacterium]
KRETRKIAKMLNKLPLADFASGQWGYQGLKLTPVATYNAKNSSVR